MNPHQKLETLKQENLSIMPEEVKEVLSFEFKPPLMSLFFTSTNMKKYI